MSDDIYTYLRGSEERLRTLIESIGLSQTADGGYTLLLAAIRRFWYSKAILLITSGAKVNIERKYYRDQTPLHMAIFHRQMDIADLLLSKGADIYAISDYGLTSIGEAINRGTLEFLEMLFNRGVDLNARGPDGLRPLHIAAKDGNGKAAVLLLSYGADIDACSTDYKSALCFAAEKGDLEVVKLLLQFEPDVNNEGNKKALYVAMNNSKKLVESLLEYGFIYELEPACDPKFFHAAIKQGFVEIVEDLLTYGADANMDLRGEKPLLLVTKIEQTDIADLLLSHGADVNAQDSQKKTPIYYALKSRNFTLVKILLTHGATVNGYPDVIYDALSVESPEIVEELLTHGADANVEDQRTPRWHHVGKTPLLMAIEKNRPAIAKLLLFYGADVNVEDRMKKTPIYYALKSGNTKLVKILLAHGAPLSDYSHVMQAALSVESLGIVKELLKYGADANVHYYRETPLLLAIRKVDLSLVEDLLKNGADANQGNHCGETPLLMAVNRNQPDIAKLLLFYGVDVNAQDRERKRPIHFAVKSKNFKIVEIFLSHGATVNDYPDVMKAALSVESPEIVKILLKYGADANVHYYGETPLLLAIRKVDLSLVEDLLRNGADANKASRRVTPLQMAIKTNRLDIAELLFFYGADVNSQDGDENPPIYYAAESGNAKLFNVVLTHGATICDYPHILHAAISGKSPEIVEQLLNLSNVHINECIFKGTSALQASLESSCADVTALLLDKGANVNLRCGKNEDTPLHVASGKGDHGICETMLKKGAAVGSKNKKGRTPLHCAVQAETVKTLIHSGADIHARDLRGRTPLLTAASKGNENVVEALLKFGANVDSTDRKGKTALHLACQSLEPLIIRLLLIYGADINICDKYNSTSVNRAYSYFVRGSGGEKVEAILKELFLHLEKMYDINLYMSDTNYTVYRQAHDLPFLPDNVLWEQFQRCKEEIEKLQATEINNSNVTYYEFLTKKTSSLAVLLGNQNILQAFQPENAYAEEFPNYAPLLKFQYRKAMERKGLVEQSYEIFGFLCHKLPPLPTCCVEEIFQYFSNIDLQMILAVRVPPRQCSTEDEPVNKVITYDSSDYNDDVCDMDYRGFPNYNDDLCDRDYYGLPNYDDEGDDNYGYDDDDYGVGE